MEKYGFEIFIGDQSSENFGTIFSSVEKIDILLDDGGHTNENQIVTLNNVISNINDDGLIVTEDTAASFSEKHFNPSKYSFINYSKFLIDDLYAKSEDKLKLKGVIKKRSLNNSIYAIKFFNSIVAFFVDKRKCIDKKNILNRDLKINPSDIIKEDFINPKWTSKIYTTGFVNNMFSIMSKIFFFLKKINFVQKIIKKIKNKLISNKLEKKLKKYFE